MGKALLQYRFHSGGRTAILIGVASLVVMAIGGLALTTRSLSAVVGWSQGGEQAPADGPAETPMRGVSDTSKTYRCAECGTVVSVRELVAPESAKGAAAGSSGLIVARPRGIDGKPMRSAEITIRLQDGSTRVITDAHPAKWRQGHRVKVIAGAS